MIDKNAAAILQRLENAGFEAFLVGGCVRDMLMERKISDYDITTNALPETTAALFPDCRVIPTGLKHGTVTVLMNGTPFEITTYRIDGSYSDSRRPDSVEFTSCLNDDLARRDFTINAIAMDLRGNIRDPFNGSGDIEKRLIRCVGNPVCRFTKDALRILRAVRFASVLGFDIDRDTACAAVSLRERLEHVSAERIRAELTKLICGKNVTEVMLGYRDIFGQIIPELIPCFDCDQHSPYHKYDVYEHTVRAVAAVPEDNALLRMTMLLHDLGKPVVFRLDENGRGHFKKHAEVGAQLTLNVMKRLKFDNASIDMIYKLIFHHSEDMFTEEEMRRVLAEMGPELFDLLMDVKTADNKAKNEFVLEENLWFRKCRERAKELVAEGFCLSLGQLAVNGNDMSDLGFRGYEIGEVLRRLLRKVVDLEIPNERDALIAAAKEELKP